MAQDTEKSSEKCKLPVNSRLLDLFWELAEGEDAVRNQATEKMIGILKEKQKNEQQICKELEYATKRLLKGLASSRKLARVGYATTLCQLLRAFPVVSTASILTKMKTELQITRQDQKSDQSNIVLGRVMAHLALMQSGTLFQGTTKEIGEVVKYLVEIRTKKAPIHQLCVQALCQIIAKSLAGKDFLLEHWGCKKIVSEKNFEKIKDILKQSTVDHPLIHNIGPEIVRRAMKSQDLFSAFWSQVISDKIITQKMERRYLGFQLILVALRNANSQEQVKVIMTDTIVQAILTNLSHKDRPLHAPVKKLSENLQLFLETCTKGEIQLTVIASLICNPGSVMFDAITNSKIIHNMVAKLTPEGYVKWTKLMMDLVRGKTKSEFSDFTGQNPEDLVQYALAELSRSITAPQMASQREWHKQLLKFLLLHGFFNIKVSVATIPMCEVRSGKSEFSDKSRTAVQNAVFKAMDRMATYRAPGERAAKDPRPYIQMLYELTQYVQSLLDVEGKVELHGNLSAEVLEEWAKVTQSIEDVRSKHTKDTKMSESHAFELLFISLGLQLFSQPKDAMDILEDLHVCYKKAFVKKKRISMKPQSEPEWVEVVTEMLLSLLSQGSHLVRFVTTTVFQMLSPHMTKPALQLVLNALISEEEGPLGFEEDDEESEEEEDEDEEGSKDSGMEEEEDGESSDNDDESSDEEDNDEPDIEVNEALRKSLKQALGKAAAPSDEEDEEGEVSDLDDDAMFKLDGALAQVFKSMMKNRKNLKEEKEKLQQHKNFQLRSLDLINGFVMNDPAPSLALELLFPLLQTMDKGAQDKALVDVGKKATTVFNNLVAPKKISADPLLDQDSLPDIVKRLIDFSITAHGVPMILSVASACLFVIRVLLGIESNTGPSPVRTRSRSVLVATAKEKKKESKNYDSVQSVITGALQSFCEKRDTHLNHMLFHTMFERQPSILWPQADVLLSLLQDDTVRIFCRTQVCGMLAVMMKKETVAGIGDSAWQEFSDKICMVLPEMLGKIEMSNLKPRYVYELMYLILRICSTNEHTATSLLTNEVIEKVKQLQTNVKKDTKKLCRKIINLTESNKKRKPGIVKHTDTSPTKRPRLMDNDNAELSANDNKAAEQPGQCKTPRKDLVADLATPKSTKKKKRKSETGIQPMDIAEELSTPKGTSAIDQARKQKSEKKKRRSDAGIELNIPSNTHQSNSLADKTDSPDDPEGVGANLELNFSPKIKAKARRKSTRGTPKINGK